jgi:DNA-binding NarL/FixJ family response regulator
VNDGPIRILIVDDHALVRDALSECLQKEPDLAVVGTAGTAEEALDRVRQCNPQIILMDIDMPGLICFDAAREITSLQPDVRIVFLSAFLNDWYIEQALRVRARGYLTKHEPPERIAAAIREVSAGGACFSPPVRSRIVVDSEGAKLGETAKSRTSTLTTREVEVLRYIARGLAKKQIASLLHISVKTVDKHSVNLMTKLDIHDRVELARFAIREGLAEA